MGTLYRKIMRGGLSTGRRLVIVNQFQAGRLFSTDRHALKNRFKELIPVKQAEMKDIKARHGDKMLGTCTVEQAYGGMRSVKSMVWEPSLLDSEEGIRFRGLTIPDCQEQLPRAPGGSEPLPEALIWLLITGEVPTQAQADSVSADLAARGANVSDYVLDTITLLAKNGVHPMSQLTAAISAAQKDSVFAKEYQQGVSKKEYWNATFEDAMNILAILPTIAAQIYRKTYNIEGEVPKYDAKLDWSANYARMMGFTDPIFDDLMRIYMVIHSDHEGGNVSAHTCHLVGSALSDPYLSFAASMCGLAGPLHGLANQEVLRWTQDLQAKILKEHGTLEVSDQVLTDMCWDTLNGGRVIPGFGHAVLRKTDPRYMAQRDFALKYMPDDPLVKLIAQLYKVVPKVLTEHGKTANPFPNVDAHSGALLVHFGLTQENYYTVAFGVSRAIGVLSQHVWSRALGLPLERPKSVTSEWIKNKFD